MTDHPYVLVSCAMSVDGRIDDASGDRLILSSPADLDRVDEVRAGCDAILVGAATIRSDNPRLTIRSPARRAARAARGAPEDPVKVTLTASGDLDPAASFFTAPAPARLVYCARPALAATRARLSGLAEVIDAGDSPSPAPLVQDLAERGVARLLLEGGGRLATEFLTGGLADELHLVVAPFFVGDPDAPRFAGPGRYPFDPAHRMLLAEVRQLDDVVLLRYLLRPEPAPAGAARAAPARVILRPPAAGDQSEFLTLVRASASLHSPWMSLPVTAEEFRAYLRRYEQPSEESLLVCLRDTGALAGVIHISNIIRGRFQSGSLSYAAFAPTAGQGYLSEGLGLAVRYAFEELRLHRLEASIQPGNHASVRLVQRLGFRYEGYAPEMLFIDGAWRDHERWAITTAMTGYTAAQPHPSLPER